MDNYRKLSFRLLKSQKVRCIFTIIGVAFVTSILYTICNLFQVFMDSQIRSYGDYEIAIYTENTDVINEIVARDDVKSAYIGDIYNYDTDEEDQNVLCINVVNPYKMKKKAEEIGSKYNVEYRLNEDLVDLYYPMESIKYRLYILVIAMIMMLISVVGIGMIRNSMELFLYENIQSFGILRCIGATKKQINAMIFIMSATLEAIGIVLGIVLGFPVSYLVGLILDIKSSNHVLPVIAIVCIFIFDLIFLILDDSKIVKMISPVEAVKGTLIIKNKSGKVRNHKLIRKIFGIEGEYTYNNLMRNKGHFIRTIVAISLGFAIPIISITISTNINNLVNDVYDMAGEYQIKCESYSLDGDIEKAQANLPSIAEIKKIAEDKHILAVKPIYSDLVITDKETINRMTTEYLEYTGMFGLGNESTGKYRIGIYGADEEDMNYFKQYLVEGTMDVDENGIIVPKWGEKYDYNYLTVHKKLKVWDYELGDKVKLNGKEYTVEGILDLDTNELTMSLLMPINNYFELTGYKEGDNNGIAFKVDRKYAINKMKMNFFLNDCSLSRDSSAYIVLLSESMYMTTTKKVMLAIGFAILFICVVNTINVSGGSINQRKKEFAQLRVIGMSKKKLSYTVALEGFFIALMSGIIGNAVALLIVASFKGSLTWIGINVIKYPIAGVLLLTLMIFVVYIGISYIQIYRNLNNIADDLRDITS